MPGEPRPDQEKSIDIPGITNELESISSQWDEENPMNRDEADLRRREADISSKIDQLIDAHVTAESDPNLLQSVKDAITTFDDTRVTLKLKELEAKMEGKEFVPKDYEKEMRLPLPDELE